MQEYLTFAVGLEGLISRDVMARSQAQKETRMNHARAVLQEHREQKLRGQVSASRLARVAKQSSGWSRQRAHRVAVVNASAP